MFSLYLERGELEYLAANWDRAIATFDEALAHAASVLDRCRVNQYKVMLYRAKNEAQDVAGHRPWGSGGVGRPSVRAG